MDLREAEEFGWGKEIPAAQAAAIHRSQVIQIVLDNKPHDGRMADVGVLSTFASHCQG